MQSGLKPGGNWVQVTPIIISVDPLCWYTRNVFKISIFLDPLRNNRGYGSACDIKYAYQIGYYKQDVLCIQYNFKWVDSAYANKHRAGKTSNNALSHDEYVLYA